MKPAYGITELGRLWLHVVQGWIRENNIKEVPREPQIFVKRNSQEFPVLIFTKVVDDFLLVDYTSKLHLFHEQISRRIPIGCFTLKKYLIVYHLSIIRFQHSSIAIGMQEYKEKIYSIYLPVVRRKLSSSRTTAFETKAFKVLTWSLNFFGHGFLPQAPFVASSLEQSVGNLKVDVLLLASRMLLELKNLSHHMRYSSKTTALEPICLTFSDANQGKSPYS